MEEVVVQVTVQFVPVNHILFLLLLQVTLPVALPVIQLPAAVKAERNNRVVLLPTLQVM